MLHLSLSKRGHQSILINYDEALDLGKIYDEINRMGNMTSAFLRIFCS